jgi:membrane associated rhomboid family serine protease
MGLLDREYYREEEGGPLAAWLRRGLCTKILVAVNILAFIIQIASQGRANSGPFAGALALIGDPVMQGEIWRLVTYSFLHATDGNGLLPFLFNVTLLWVIGHEVEERLGVGPYAAFYLLAAAVGGLALLSAARFGLNGATLEATRMFWAAAPITALLVWLTLNVPRHRVTFFYSLSVPIWMVLAVAIGFDVWGFVLPGDSAADGRRLTLVGHFGASLFAIAVYGATRQPRRHTGRRPVRRARPDLRIFREEKVSEAIEETRPTPSSSPEADELLEEQLDAVLAKVAAHGQTSLNPAEREVLQRASEVYRRRRR